MVYQKKITKRGSLRASTSASVSIQCTFAHDDGAFRFVAKFEQHHYLLIIYLVHRCLFKRLCVQTHVCSFMTVDGSFAQGEDIVMYSSY